jgi:pyruvate-ferredoxin/flavodoxin oxidoreductase
MIRGKAAPAPHAGRLQLLDGVSAVAAVEARVCDVAGLGASYPAALAARVWGGHETGLKLNALNAPITGVDTDSPRAAFAAAMGAAMAGRRATVFLSGPDALQCRDLLAEAAGRHLPLVVHLVLRAGAGHAQALGTGHEAYHALEGVGALRFLAASVQEAVDLAVIARRASEVALVPAIVAMDAEQTALAVQSVAMPDDGLVREFLGSATDVIPPASAAQRTIFGETRRRVPAVYDLERPVALGSLQGPEAWALGAAAGRVFLDADIARVLAEAVQGYGALTGREHLAVRTHKTGDAKIVLVAQGSLVEQAIGIADWARAQKMKVGVVGVQRSWPVHGSALALALRGAEVVCVLERVASSAGDDGPLLRRVRALMDRCRENGQFGPDTHPGLPAMSAKDTPRLIGAAAGLGGLPVRGADLALLVRELAAPKRAFHPNGIWVGLDLVHAKSAYPKHQALMDAVRRDYPVADGIGLRDREAAFAPTVQELTTIAVQRPAGRALESFAGQLATLAFGLAGSKSGLRVRSRPGISWQRAEQLVTDRVSFGVGEITDPGDDAAVDIAVLADAGAMPGCVREGATVVVLADEALAIGTGGRKVLTVACDSDDAAARREALLGGALKVLMGRLGGEAPGPTQVRARRAEMLGELGEGDRERLLGAFVAGFEGVRELGGGAGEGAAASAGAEVAPPAEVMAMPRTGGLASLPRFWDHAGVFYKSGAMDELVGEPAAAMGTTPALSSVFRDSGRGSVLLPVFVPGECDGSPAVWMSCPDGSVAALAITPKALLEAGLDLATRAGAQADALRPVIGQLVKRVAKIAMADTPPTTAGEIFGAAFGDVASKLDESRAASIRGAFDAVVAQIGGLPIAVTEAFFRDAEHKAPGSGAFLSLAVNPDACKCPELIGARGAGHGVVLEQRTAGAVERARAGWALWQSLPDTSGEIIERVRKDDRIGPLAAMMLSRHCLHAMAPGDGAEAGSGAKLALRQVLAVAEFHYQPRTQRLVGLINELRGRLSERIQKQLAAALPTADLEALSAGLETLGRGDVELGALSSKIDSAIVNGHVDGELLARLVDAARGLADLEWKLTRGPLGLGRARVGLALAAGSVAAWAGAYPYNPFLSPVAIDAAGEAGGLARGVLEGYLREVIDGFRLLRLARLEIDRPNEAPHAAARLAGLTYADLTADERELVPPMVLVGDGQSLGGRGLSQLVWLFESGLPIKVVVLSDIGGRADGALSLDSMGSYPPAQRYDISLLAMLSRKAFVTQCSLAHAGHFASSVERALATAGPALVHVHAPSPERHGFGVAGLFEQAALAVASRAWPLATFDPAGAGVFGSCIDISMNPSPRDKWVYGEHGAAITPAHWAASEARFAEQITPMGREANNPVAMAEYLDLDADARSSKTPFLELGSEGGKSRFAVGTTLARDAADRARLWRTLQELSGEVTPFTEKVRREIEQSVAGARQAEVAAIKAQHEAQLAQLRAQFAAETTDNITSRLMAIAGYGGERA